jgi:glycosyltransferase involved in cell wall biosynthesis
MFRDFASDPRIKLWRYEAVDISDVYNVADCFVFPSRGEGFGLPPRESACAGIPTIALKAHGTLDVENWGIPLEKFTRTRDHLDGFGQWWEPDLDEITEKMRWVFDNANEAKEVALKGAEWIRNNQTWQHAAQKLEWVLNSLWDR